MLSAKTWIKFDKNNDTYGTFTISPLSAGMGLTLGNALRRVLLSSIRGTAVTAIKIEGVQHEFSTMENVIEDVLDIIFNIKSVVFLKHSEGPKEITFKGNVKGELLVGDFKSDADIDILTPKTKILTTSKSREVVITITVEEGVGYVPSEALVKSNQDVDVINLDASFSPIVKINHTVEKVRVGRELDHDSLVIEVWTDGSIDCEKAVKEASGYLMDHFSLFGELNKRPVVDTLAEEEDPVEKKKESALSLSVEDLELSARSLNCLKKAGIETVQELVEKDLSELIQIKNFGKKSAEEINSKLKQYGLFLKGEMVEA